MTKFELQAFYKGRPGHISYVVGIPGKQVYYSSNMQSAIPWIEKSVLTSPIFISSASSSAFHSLSFVASYNLFYLLSSTLIVMDDTDFFYSSFYTDCY